MNIRTYLLCIVLSSLGALWLPGQAPHRGTDTSGPGAPDTLQASIHVRSARSFSRISRMDSAAIYYERASRIYQDAGFLLHSERIWERYIDCLNEAGYHWMLLREYGRAQFLLNKSMTVGLNILGERSGSVATTFSYLGVVASQQGDTTAAFAHHEQALQRRRRLYGDAHLAVARSYNNIGIEHLRARNFKQAEAYFLRSLEIRETEDAYGAYEIAKSRHNLGLLAFNRGQFEEALNHYRLAEPVFLDSLGENHLFTAQLVDNIGNTYRAMERVEEALAYFRRSMRIYESLFDTLHERVGIACGNIASVCEAAGRYEAAESYYRRALVIAQNHWGRDHETTATIFHRLGRVALAQGRHAQAEEHLRAALLIRLDALHQLHPGIAAVYSDLATLEEQRGSIAAAIRTLQQAIVALTPGFGDSNIYANPPLWVPRTDTRLVQLLLRKAALFLKLRASDESGNTLQDFLDLESGLATLALASDMGEYLRTRISTRSLDDSLEATLARIHNSGIDASLRLADATGEDGYYEEAMNFIERGRISALLKATRDAGLPTLPGVPDTILNRAADHSANLNRYLELLNSELRKGREADSTRLLVYQDRVHTSANALEAQLKAISTSYPSYYSLRYDAMPVSMAILRERVLRQDEMLLVYHVQDTTLLIIGVSRSGATAHRGQWDDDLRQRLDQFRTAIRSEEYAFQAPGFELFQELLQPVLAGREGQGLIIVPGDSLANLPFEAFPTEASRKDDHRKVSYALREHTFSYAHSATLLARAGPGYTFKDLQRYLGVSPLFEAASATYLEETALSTLNLEASLLAKAVGSRGEILPVDGAGREISVVSSRLRELNVDVTVSTYQAATEARFIGLDFKGRSLIHLVTHGLLDHSAPDAAFLFARNPYDATDGLFAGRDWYHLPLDARLLMFTGLETPANSGAGSIHALSAIFTAAGAQSQLLTLWRPAAPASEKLVAAMVDALATGLSPAAALRRSKLELIQAKETAHPAAWSPFLLYGR